MMRRCCGSPRGRGATACRWRRVCAASESSSVARLLTLIPPPPKAAAPRPAGTAEAAVPRLRPRRLRCPLLCIRASAPCTGMRHVTRLATPSTIIKTRTSSVIATVRAARGPGLGTAREYISDDRQTFRSRDIRAAAVTSVPQPTGGLRPTAAQAGSIPTLSPHDAPGRRHDRHAGLKPRSIHTDIHRRERRPPRVRPGPGPVTARFSAARPHRLANATPSASKPRRAVLGALRPGRAWCRPSPPSHLYPRHSRSFLLPRPGVRASHLSFDCGWRRIPRVPAG